MIAPWEIKVCDLCHEETWALYPWRRTYNVCSPCYDYGLYYDGLTGDDLIAEEAMQATYCRHLAADGACDCQHRHRP